LIKFVGDKVFDDLYKKKIKLVYGYPNLRAYNLHIKFWKYENIIKQYTFVLKKNLNYKKPLFKAIQISKFDKEHDLFWKKNKKKYIAILDRRSSFLNWRYLSRPDKKYICYKIYNSKKIYQGYFILKIYNEESIKKVHIVDLFFKNIEKKYCSEIIKTILYYINKKKFKQNEISLWLNGDKNFIYSLKKLGFVKNSYRNMIMKGIDGNFFRNNKISLKNLYFTMGDTLEIY